MLWQLEWLILVGISTSTSSDAQVPQQHISLTNSEGHIDNINWATWACIASYSVASYMVLSWYSTLAPFTVRLPVCTNCPNSFWTTCRSVADVQMSWYIGS